MANEQGITMPSRLPEDDPRLERILIDEDRIQVRLHEMARDIIADAGHAGRLRLIGVLKGGWIFLADLARAIRRENGPHVLYEFIRASAYGSGIKATGETERHVTITGLPEDIHGDHVVLVEDILDQGFTLSAIRTQLLAMGAASVKVCVFLDKQLESPEPAVQAIRAQLVPHYVGFPVPDRWVVGYGLDIDEGFRDLPYLAIAREEYFQS
jgi:hypoxanthine phosphoribosyltransferase